MTKSWWHDFSQTISKGHSKSCLHSLRAMPSFLGGLLNSLYLSESMSLQKTKFQNLMIQISGAFGLVRMKMEFRLNVRQIGSRSWMVGAASKSFQVAIS